VRSLTTLHLANAYHPASGGIRTFYDALLRRAEAQQRVVHLVVPSDRDDVETRGRFARVHHLRARRAPGFDRRYRLFLPVHYRTATAPLSRLLAALQPDVIEVSDKYTLTPLAWSLRRRPAPRPTLIGFSHERLDDNVTAFLPTGSAGRAAAAWYLRHFYVPAFDGHLANSAYTAAELLDQRAGEVGVCGMGVDAAAFTAAGRDPSLRERLLAAAGGGPSSRLVLYVGRMSPEKHVDRLIEAFAMLTAWSAGRCPTDLRLVLVGAGPAAMSIAALAARRTPGRVALLPHVTDRRTLARHYAAADVFVHPNPREPFGIGPLEAMAAGAPVVVPRAGGVLAYAGDHNAWLADPEADGLARAMLAALTGGRADARVTRAVETARRHDWPIAIDRYFAAVDAMQAARERAPSPRRAAAPGVAVTRSRAPATTPGRW